MRILKRNNEATKFEQSKIENAILKAMKYGSGVYDEELAKKIAIEIKEECEVAAKIVGLVTVRNVEDMVYSKLIKYNQHEVSCISKAEKEPLCDSFSVFGAGKRT